MLVCVDVGVWSVGGGGGDGDGGDGDYLISTNTCKLSHMFVLDFFLCSDFC